MHVHTYPCLFSIKYTGILGMGFLGIVVLVDLYQLIGDKDVSLISYSHGFFVRGIALVGIPLLMNMGLFYIHFTLLTKAGIHDGWLSPQMRANMEVLYLCGIIKYCTVYTINVQLYHHLRYFFADKCIRVYVYVCMY